MGLGADDAAVEGSVELLCFLFVVLMKHSHFWGPHLCANWYVVQRRDYSEEFVDAREAPLPPLAFRVIFFILSFFYLAVSLARGGGFWREMVVVLPFIQA